VGATFAARAPHPSLRGVVLGYEGYTEQSPDPVLFRELPCSYVPIIIDLESGWTVSQAGRPSTLMGSFVGGITDGPVLVGHDGHATCLQVNLTALGARRLLGVPMHEIANRTVALDDVLGSAGRQLVQLAGDTADWPGRFDCMDRVLAARLAQAPEPDTELAWSLARITARPIGDMAAELGWSHRRLIARYRDAVGLPPKTVARIVRFEKLTSRLKGSSTVDWAALAAEGGFFDQAHLSREDRELTGQTPTELLASMVNFVQDGVAMPS
jgi:AraC-like DNA-binding protein